jgi:hypothetical protein
MRSVRPAAIAGVIRQTHVSERNSSARSAAKEALKFSIFRLEPLVNLVSRLNYVPRRVPLHTDNIGTTSLGIYLRRSTISRSQQTRVVSYCR